MVIMITPLQENAPAKEKSNGKGALGLVSYGYEVALVTPRILQTIIPFQSVLTIMF
jgi:hypothetical protein